uniref:Uncharacterized protein n=1 Tax=Setaria digitata TaxID=48799 RepID=A0A915PR17_9BILA
MISFPFLIILGSIRPSQTCLPVVRRFYEQEFDVEPIPAVKWINELEDTVTDLNTRNHIYEYYGQKGLKNEACHSCPDFEPPNCTTFKKSVRCVTPKVWYHRGSYCLFAEFACNRSFHALRGRLIDKIRLDSGYADPNEDDTKHETYGIHQLHRLDEKKIQRFPVKGFSDLSRESVHCMTDKRWYYRSHQLSVIIRADQIYCL